MSKFFFPLLFLLLIFSAQAQEISVEDSVPAVKVADEPVVKRHSVKRAVIQSALVPGWGQIYNKKYWKPPIIYAGLGGLGFAIGWNAKRWRTYSDAYRARVDLDSTTVDAYEGVYSADNLATLKNFYKRNMDLAIIFTAVLYALNIIDAAVDAHLFEFDISDDLTMRAEPVFNFSNERSKFAGISLTLRL